VPRRQVAPADDPRSAPAVLRVAERGTQGRRGKVGREKNGKACWRGRGMLSQPPWATPIQEAVGGRSGRAPYAKPGRIGGQPQGKLLGTVHLGRGASAGTDSLAQVCSTSGKLGCAEHNGLAANAAATGGCRQSGLAVITRADRCRACCAKSPRPRPQDAGADAHAAPTQLRGAQFLDSRLVAES